MIFVHGYNVGFKDAIFKSAQMKYDLSYEWPILLFSWPSKNKKRYYSSDKENALYSSKNLAKLLDIISTLNVEEVIVVAHSMGTFCLAEALSQVREETAFQRLALAAADIDKQAFINQYADRIKDVFSSTTLYMSDSDVALLASSLANDSDRVGFAKNDVLVIDNMDSIDMTNLDEGFFTLGHSYVSENNRALDDLFHYLVCGHKVGERRLKSLTNKLLKKYWTLHA